MLKAVIIDLCEIADISDSQHLAAIPFLEQLLIDLVKNEIKVVNMTPAFQSVNDRSSAYSILIKQLLVSSDECITITDTYYGLLSAGKLGITCIAYLNPNILNQDLYKAALLVEGFEEIDYSFLNRIYQYDHMEAATILTTDNFIIRELSVDDIENLLSIYRDPSVNAFFDDFVDSIMIEKEKLEAYIKNIYHFYGYGLWGVYQKENDQLVGRCGVEYKLLENEEIYELGYLLAKPYQGLGYAREFVTAVIDYCFLELNLPYLIAIIDKDNIASIHLAERAGMLNTGLCTRNSREYYKYKITNI